MGRLLLIDDDQVLLAAYENILTGEGHKVVRALDGQEALIKMQNEKVDLIITDLQMPKMSGQKFIEILQQQKGSIPCPIIISSGFIDNSIITSFGGSGRIHFLPKPTAHKELIEKVRDLLSSSPAKTKIDVRFINPVLQSTIDVISTLTGIAVTAGKPQIKKLGEISGDISGVVGVVSSGFKGTISISFSEAGFLKVLSKMLQEECTVIDDDNKDAVAELLNIIFGKAKKILNESGMNIQPAIPTIVRGKDHILDHHNQHPTIVIIFNSAETGEFRTEVAYIG
jgi:chemotaxis protein CheX